MKSLSVSLAFILSLWPVAALAQSVAGPTLDVATLRSNLGAMMDPPGKAMPGDVGNLDALLKQNADLALGDRLKSSNTEAAIVLDMNWEQARLYEGGGFFLSYSYFNDAWRLGSALPSPTGEALKQTAAVFFLYTISLVIVDGPTCGDLSAPGHRFDQLLAQNRPLAQYLIGLPRAQRMQLGSIAASLEAATSGVRTHDYVLCSGGMAQMTHDLAAQGDKPLPQVQGPPGMYGKVVAVPSAPGYQPSFAPADQSLTKQAQARQALPATLTRLLTPANEQTPPSSPAK